MKVYGKKITLPVFPCRFPDIHDEREDGGYQIEIVVPMERAKEVNALLYDDNEKVINFNKATATAKNPRKLWSPLYLYDDEAKEAVRDDDGEKVESEEAVVFRFKSMWKPKIQFKKGLDNSAHIGFDSEVQIVGGCFGSDEKKDENGKSLKYVLLSLAGVRVHVLVEKASQEVFEESDEFEDEAGTPEKADDGFNNEAPEEEAEEKPKNVKAKANKSNKDF